MVDPDIIGEVDEAWDGHLHGLLGAPWPCPKVQRLGQIMADIDALLAARGLSSGRLTYGWYSDAESSLCRAIWCVARHTRPEVVIGSYLEGSSSQRLPPLVAKVSHVEMFVHDSLHTAENTLFEMEQAASVMSPGGVMLVDDIRESRNAFTIFTQQSPQYQAITCPAPDGYGIWGILGIVIKAATVS